MTAIIGSGFTKKIPPPVNFDRLITRIRDGHISVPLNALVSCYGGMPTEAVLRGMLYAGHIEKRFGLRLPLAVAMENQTLPYGLGALWAGAGARYSWRGVCGSATRIPNAAIRTPEVYWWVGPDDSRILMKWYSMPGKNTSIGGYAEARNPEACIDLVESDKDFLSRYPYRVIGLFGKGWDDLKTLSPEFILAAKHKSQNDRTVIVSNQEDFFRDMESTYGRGLPSQSCSYGNEWDLYCASMAETTARARRGVEQLRGAEALATLVSLKNPDFMASRETKRDTAWMALGLYWEHNWTADGPVSRAARRYWQNDRCQEISSYAQALEADSRTAFGKLIRKNGTETRFYVFNPLSWNRTDIADFPWKSTAPVHVIDLSGNTEIPSQFITVEGRPTLRILARGIPPVGYRVYEVRQGAGKTFSNAATVRGNDIENEPYRIRVDGRGAILSLIDKKRGNREFAHSIGNRAINDLGPGKGSLSVENVGPVSVTIKANSPTPIAHTTRITLIRDSTRIDIRNDINQNFDSILTWGFSFNLAPPDVHHEEVGAVIRARLTNDGGEYSPRNARYDYLTLNHFADMSSNGVGITLSNADCCFMQLGNSTPTFLDTATPKISVLAGGQVDGPRLGIPRQGDCSHFIQRFSLMTHDSYNAAESMRFALEHQNPLLTGIVTGGDAYPETDYSFLKISDPSVLLWALKPPEDNSPQSIVLRLWNLSNKTSPFTVNFSTPITDAQRITHIETTLRPAVYSGATLKEILAKNEMGTYSTRWKPQSWAQK